MDSFHLNEHKLSVIVVCLEKKTLSSRHIGYVVIVFFLAIGVEEVQDPYFHCSSDG